MKICIILGTRPEIIKMSPIIKECEKRKTDFFIIHSNQHYSDSMDTIFFKELNIPNPKYNLNVGSGTHTNQIGNIILKIGPILNDESPDVVLVQGDTNTVIAGGLAASKLGIKVGHVEAGLRSYDRTMPEETNRVITDHFSDYLFAVSDTQKKTLANEGIDKDKIYVVGNSIVDAIYQNKNIANNKSTILTDLNLVPQQYTLFTVHRASNVDNKQDLIEIIKILFSIEGKVCWPIHLRTKNYLKKFNLSLPEHIIICHPLGYFDFLNLEQHARLIVTDSGGVQEEACILGIPCLTLRNNTERLETLQVGANFLVGRDSIKFKEVLNSHQNNWVNPFGDGDTSVKILDIINRKIVHRKEKNYIEENTINCKDSVSVIGLGYMGLPMAILIAQAGYEVRGIDIDKNKIDSINNGVPYFEEKNLFDLLNSAIRSKKLKASSELKWSNIYLISVPTPLKQGKCDLSYVLQACHSVSNVAKNGDLLIIESTIKPNTCNSYIRPIFLNKNIDINICHCPERAIPGNTFHELIHNDRIVGGLTEKATNLAANFYRSFVKGNILKTKAINAECAKLMENTYRDVNIALANELDEIARHIGFDVNESISLANYHPRVNILRPGPGVGGHCIPIDPWFLIEDFKDSKLIKLSREINDNRPRFFSKIIKDRMNEINAKKAGVLGIAYKKNVDDKRETPTYHIVKNLISFGLEVRVHDPYIKIWSFHSYSFEELSSWADVYILVTDHDVFRGYKFNRPVIKAMHLLKN